MQSSISSTSTENKRIHSWRRILYAGTAGLILLYLAWWGRMIVNPVERSSADFIAFYSAGRVAHIYGFPSVYHIEYQRQIEQGMLGFPLAEQQVLLYNHMPYLAPLLAVVVDRSYIGSFVRWVFLLLILYVCGTLYFLKSLFADRPQLQAALFAGALTFFPLFISLWQGQDTAFLYAGVALWCVGLLKNNDWLMATGLTLATVRPHISLAFSIPLLLKYQRAWRHSILFIAILAAISFMLLNVQGTREFLNVLSISAKGQWFGMKPEAMPNLLGLLLRLAKPDSSTASWIGWGIYLTGTAILGILWLRSNAVSDNLLGLSVLIAVATAPHLHLHDLTLLIFPVLLIVHERMLASPQPGWMLLPLGVSLFLLVGFLLEAVYFIVPYAVFMMLGWLLAGRERAGWIAGNQDTG